MFMAQVSTILLNYIIIFLELIWDAPQAQQAAEFAKTETLRGCVATTVKIPTKNRTPTTEILLSKCRELIKKPARKKYYRKSNFVPKAWQQKVTKFEFALVSWKSLLSKVNVKKYFLKTTYLSYAWYFNF